MSTSGTADDRVTDLLTKAEQHRKAGNSNGALEALTAASSFDPANKLVQQSLRSLQQPGQDDTFITLLKEFNDSNDEAIGKKVLQALRTKPPEAADAVAALNLLLSRSNPNLLDDQLLGSLLSLSLDVRKELASRLKTNVTVLFDKFYAVGLQSFRAFAGIPLDESAWTTKGDRDAAQRDVFQLCIAKLMDTSVDHPDRVLEAMTRQLTMAPSTVKNLVDADVFEVVLTSLDIRNESPVRSQAMLTAAKMFEITAEKGERIFSDFITSAVAKKTSEDLVVAFSAASAIFPIVATVAAKLFLTEGFVQQLVPTLERNSYAAMQGHRENVTLERAALELLSAACVDKACREAIHTHCLEWLQSLAQERDSSHHALVTLILAKIDSTGQEEIATRLTGLVLSSDKDRDQAVEGLAYTSLQPKVKESVSSDEALLKRLVTGLAEGSGSAFGYLTVFHNLTIYRPSRSEEQKRIAQLKAYANSSKPAPEDPLDDDAHVTARIKRLISAGLVPVMASLSKQTSSITNIALIVGILLASSKEQKHRPTLVQQGAVRSLFQLRDRLSQIEKAEAEKLLVSRQMAHTLARLLISVNPSHVFSSGLSSTSAVSAITPLLSENQEGEERDLLPTFEALLALTNLASMEDSSARELQIRTSFDKIEDLLFSPNVLIQRATVELVCNLMMSPSGVAKFADGSKDANRRMQILLALADVDDVATRRAAGGALAMLTEWDAAASAILAKDRGLQVLLTMCEDNSDEIKHRGLVCLANVLGMAGDLGAKATEMLKAKQGAEVVKGALKKTRNTDILTIGVEVLKKLA